MRRRWSRSSSGLTAAVCALALAGAVALAGCGGDMRPEELARSVQTLASSAAEGALLAGDAAADRTKTTFVRAHARELGETVEHEAEKLSDASATGEVATAKQRAIDLADEIAAALGRMQISPDDAAEARAAAQDLMKLADEAGRLAERL